ncbi:alpha/beta hydrolase family protein [Ferroacidibacillus organovorans]|uniref:Peptidase S9 prolyl oligopeptidase catalytic domain-containing protein n=1 Tax=Ferroacidibacillus organovorans TaxID=1765683 RepID=A0A853KBG7_9BACL|nr:prolyl oligopeptidase family serine peptidase [Ferroacidibacillus organovorans]KYP80562.1 hypothetical protein AYJ22_10875 [Ferroacidibacillus organovorans]OAG93469.1 hypothetical protein AYW79_10595 [Ferroacidibacillus organovorans]
MALRKGIDIKAATVISGLADFLDGYNKRNDMKPICERIVGHPDTHKNEYIARSATYWADEINVPILIIHGAKDKHVPVEQVREFVKKLGKYKKTHTYIEYPDGEHGLKPYGLEYQDKIHQFFRKYI